MDAIRVGELRDLYGIRFVRSGQKRVLPAAAVPVKKQPLAQIQAAYSTGALSKSDDAQWTFLVSL